MPIGYFGASIGSDKEGLTEAEAMGGEKAARKAGTATRATRSWDRAINGALSAGLDSPDEELKKHESTLESVYTLLIETQKSGKPVFVAPPQLQGLQGLAGVSGLGCPGKTGERMRVQSPEPGKGTGEKKSLNCPRNR